MSACQSQTTTLARVDRSFDKLIVGAGFGGSVLAERFARQPGKRVLLVDQRPHIGGDAHERFDDAGILIHPHSPHIVHTNSSDVFDYLSQFTAWRSYQHRVRASVDGQLLPKFINLDTVNRLYGLSLTSSKVEAFFASVVEKVDLLRTSKDVVVARVGRDLYDKFLRGHTRKAVGAGPVDAFFDCRYGRLPYRSLAFEHVTLQQAQAQPVGTVNHPNDHAYTRFSEFKHLTRQEHPSTFLVHEYPQAQGEPFYPLPRPENAALYKRCETEAEQLSDVTFVGRLDNYWHHNRDQVVGQALLAHKRMTAVGATES